MDLTKILDAFIEDMLGVTSAYGLAGLSEQPGAGEAAAVIRHRLTLYQALLADGWNAPPGLAEQIERDERLLLEADDELPSGQVSLLEEHASIRARASRVRAEARRTSEDASVARTSSTDMRTELAQMRQAMESRAVIEQAKGIAMERFGLSADVAWSWLVRTSQQQNVKLRVVAQEIVSSVSEGAAPRGARQNHPLGQAAAD